MPELTHLDAAPTWEGVLPVLIAAARSPDPDAQEIAEEELRRMSSLADIAVDYLKSKEGEEGQN